ncbi:MAG: radical SAM protein [Candidatus Zixiibacteriota bacterium]
MTYLVAPETVEWEITYSCNLNCIHCNVVHNKLPNESDLNILQLKRIADMLADANVFRISVGGGEPLLHPNSYELLGYLVKLGFTPLLLSNGIMLSEDVIRKLLDIGIKKIQISLDGANPETYAKIRGRKNIYNLVINNAIRAAQEGLEINISTVLTKHNKDEIPEIIDICLQIPANCYRVVSYVHTHSYGDNLQIDQRDLYSIAQYLVQKERELKNRLQVYTPTPKFLHPEDSSAIIQRIAPCKELMCEAGTILCTITPTGDLIPCTYFRDSEFIAGNLLDQSLYDIWHNSPILKSFRGMGEMSPECLSCSIHEMCHGGCRAMAYFETGDIRSLDPRCWLV